MASLDEGEPEPALPASARDEWLLAVFSTSSLFAGRGWRVTLAWRLTRMLLNTGAPSLQGKEGQQSAPSLAASSLDTHRRGKMPTAVNARKDQMIETMVQPLKKLLEKT